MRNLACIPKDVPTLERDNASVLLFDIMTAAMEFAITAWIELPSSG
jgi:hypothetical protein